MKENENGHQGRTAFKLDNISSVWDSDPTMFEMLVQRSVPVTPITQVTSSPGAHHSDFSPRSSNSSFESSDGLSHPEQDSFHSPNNEDKSQQQQLSALQKLQFALARDGLFSAVLNDPSSGRKVVGLCQSSSSSSRPNTPGEPDTDGRASPFTPTSNLKSCIPTCSPKDPNIFQCPLCPVVCNARHDFNEHLVTHSQQYACPKCPYFTGEESKLREHVESAHDSSDLDLSPDDELRTAKTNSQGKLKTFKCKQCGYQALTKMDFWDHSKSHIRNEKMLACPKCPFVTEYKHHLEYHLRNHVGSKPFQCNKCAYSCVNKSMLNSHLKSHSNVYQYRCADCAYATKYCHSLKLHLRKYDHKPSMVLNPDGTPNPLPIIDVYGTRRGPKIKRQDSESNGAAMASMLLSPPPPKEKTKPQKQQQHQKKVNGTKKPDPMPPHDAMKAASDIGFPQKNNTNAEQAHREGLNAAVIANNEMNRNAIIQQLSQGLPINISSLNAATFQRALLEHSVAANGRAPNPMDVAAAVQNIIIQNAPQFSVMGKTPMEVYATTLNQYLAANHSPVPQAPVDASKFADEQRRRLMSQLQLLQIHHSPPPPLVKSSIPTPPSEPKLQSPMPHSVEMDDDVLDLRNPRNGVGNRDNTLPQEKRKRKGKALKFQRSPKAEYNLNDAEQVLDFSNNNYTIANNRDTQQQLSGIPKDEGNETSVCSYCDIAFPSILYSLHMRFHSPGPNPFQCNVCGTNSSDKVSFFVHLATASH